MLSLLDLIQYVIQLYLWCVIISVALSWLVAFNVVNTRNRFVYTVGDVLHRITEPALSRIRRWMPNLGNVDLSPVVLIILLYFLSSLLSEYWPR
jgi:YggT family protein